MRLDPTPGARGRVRERDGDGLLFDLDLTYKVQVEAGGIAQVVGMAESFAGDDDLIVRDHGTDGALEGRRDAIADYYSNRTRAMAAEPGSYRPLEPQALKALFPGSFQAEVHGYKVNFVARQDGSLVGSSQRGTDTGQWSVEQGELCIMLSSWLSGRTACSQVVQQGDWYRADNVVFRKL